MNQTLQKLGYEYMFKVCSERIDRMIVGNFTGEMEYPSYISWDEIEPTGDLVGYYLATPYWEHCHVPFENSEAEYWEYYPLELTWDPETDFQTYLDVIKKALKDAGHG